MSTIRYIADTHFGHKNIIAYDNRPFATVEEMDDMMVAMWNSVVARDDITYVVGDFCWSQTYEDWVELLRRLHGQVFIVKGNHDRTEILKELAYKRHIAGWSQQVIVKDNGSKVVLNHSPMPFFINQHQPEWAHLYGHVHVSFDWNMMLNMHRQISGLYCRPIRMYNVGCMVPYVKYFPRTLTEIEEGFRKLDHLQLNFGDKQKKEPRCTDEGMNA